MKVFLKCSNDWGLHGLSDLGPAQGTEGQTVPPALLHRDPETPASLCPSSQKALGKLAARRAGLGSCWMETFLLKLLGQQATESGANLHSLGN